MKKIIKTVLMLFLLSISQASALETTTSSYETTPLQESTTWLENHKNSLPLTYKFYLAYQEGPASEYSQEELSAILFELKNFVEQHMPQHFLDTDRAPRIDAPSSEANDAVAGCCNGCDLTQIQALINTIKKRIDALICIKFQDTWSILQKIDIDVNGIYTALEDIQVSVSIDLSGIFTALEFDFNNLQTIICEKFQDTWTILAEINENSINILTTIAENFQFTWSILNKIDIDINGIFTAIDNIDICPTVDLSGIFTALEFDFNNIQTIVCEKFEFTWSALQKIDIDVNGIYTALEDIQVSVSIDLSGIFTALEFDFNNLQTIICEKFQDTWTILAEINGNSINILTTIAENFQFTWSILNKIDVDINGIFTAIDNIDICPTVDLSGIFTALEFDFNNIQTIVCEKFQDTWTILAEINGNSINILTTIAENFEFTWSILNKIDIDINGIFTAIDNIDICPTVDLTGIFTALEFDFNNIQTIVCEKFEFTWSALQKIDIDINGIFTAIDNINICATTDLSGIFTALEFGFFNTQTIICDKFEQTWTILAEILATITLDCGCSAINLTQENVIGGVILLATEGQNYILCENINGDIVISGENVSLNLNDRVVTGTIDVAANDVIVKNGKIFAPTPTTQAQADIAAVTVEQGMKSTRLLNLTIQNANSTGQGANNSGINGRNGINNFGQKTWIIDCCIHSGSASNGTNNPIANGGLGGTAGTGILSIGNNTLIKTTFIHTGDGGNGGNGGTPGVFGGAGGNGGNGGIGIDIQESNENHDQIIQCTIETGVGGHGGTGAALPGGDGGSGGIGIKSTGHFVCILDSKITTSHGSFAGLELGVNTLNGGAQGGSGGHGILITSTAEHTTITNCSILATGSGNRGADSMLGLGGFGGNAGHAIFVEEACGTEIHSCIVIKTGDGGQGGSAESNTSGNGGDGGDGVRINALSKDTEVRNCTFSNTGTGGVSAGSTPGTDGTPGRAVTDLNNDVCSRFDCADDGLSFISGNYAYAIANLQQRYIINGNLGVEGGIESSKSTNRLDNIYLDCNPTYFNIGQAIIDTQTIVCEKFEFTWSILEKIDIDINNIFTVLDNLNLSVTIGEIMVSVTIDLSGVFTALEFGFYDTQTIMCAKFQDTWTILDHILLDTQTILCEKFQYTWTALEFGFFDTQTIMCAKFQDTWTILDHILLDTQTILCEKFQYTWTALEFGFFDTQTILCAKFQDTWTILDHILLDTQTVLCEKFQYTWTALEFGFFDTQTILCAKFQDTWTILDHILLDTQTILCEKFQYTWTALEFGFFDTQTILCAKFQDTWTILESLQNTGCCQATPITQALVDAGGGTYVITQSGNYTLAENITSAGTGPGTGIIQISMSDVSLNLCGRKITGNLLSLNNGIFVDPNLSNIRIENGTLAMNGLSGIFIQSGCCDIWLDNITSSSAFWGIVLNDFITPGADFIANVFINRCQATNCSGINSKSPTRFTLSASGGLIMTNCRNVTIRNSNFSENTVFTLGAATTMDVFGLFMDNCSDCSLSHCTMNTNWGTQSGTGLTMSACNNNSFEYCIFNDNRGLTSLSVASGAFGAILSSCFNNVFRNCQANNNLNDQQARGFIATQGGNNTFINCIASGNNGPGGGFIFNEENSSSCIDCQALANTATVLAGDDCVGFMSESGRNILIENCQALGMVAEDVAAGFLLMGDTASSIINCICQNSNSLTGSGYGVLLDVDLINNVTCITCFVRDNNVMTTTGLLDAFGYRDAGSPNSSSLFTGNFAFNNNTNYSVVYPSGPLPTVSGSLSGGLPATGTSGTFDNIGINV